MRNIISQVLNSSGLLKIFNKSADKRLTVLMYHRISGIDATNVYDRNVVSSSPEEFEKQMRYLAKNHNVISFADLGAKLPPKAVIVTFDDGYIDNYQHAFPILKKYGIPATIFITTGFVGSSKLPWWDTLAVIYRESRDNKICRITRELKKIPDDKKNEYISRLVEKNGLNPVRQRLFCNWREIKEMSRNGIEFGAHTVKHPILSRVTTEQASDEIRQSVKIIGQKLGKNPIVFAYPNGHKQDIPSSIDRMLKSCGIKHSVSCVYGNNKLPVFRLLRTGIQYKDDLNMFRLKMSGIGQRLIRGVQKWQ